MATTAQIYTARITKCITALPTLPEGVEVNLNCLNFFTSNIYRHPMVGDINLSEISPYVLKTSGGHIMENLWQGSKVYPDVSAQEEIKSGKLIWKHPSEIHVVNGELTSAFWAWRKKLWNNPHPVRYPNGYGRRHEVICSLWHDGKEWVTMDYITARKKIYCHVYTQLVQQKYSKGILSSTI